jgi:hypothetical protein
MRGTSISADAILSLVLLIGSIIVILVFVASIGAPDFVDQAPCTGLSMFSTLQQRFKGVTVFEAKGSRMDRSDLCPAMDMTISARASNEAAIAAIADQMAICHRNYGEGNIELFEQGRNKKNLYCVICSRLTIEGDGEVEGLYEYMSSEPLRGSERTYLEYLMGSDEPLELFEPEEFESFALPRGDSEQYAVVFLYTLETELFKNPAEAAVVGGVAGGVASGVVAGGLVIAAFAAAPFTVPVLVVGSAAFAAATVVGRIATLAGAWGGAQLLPSQTEYHGSVMISPWNGDFFADTLKCDQVN